MADAIWFYATGGQQQGPTDLQTLRDMAGYGQLLGSDLVWRNGMANWLPAAQVPELADAFAPTAGAMSGAQPGMPTAATASAPPPPPSGQPGGYYAPQTPQALPYGQPPGNYGHYSPGGQSYANDARTAMIIAIIGIFCVGIVLGPIGIVLGTTARRNMRASGNLEGEGMATAAIVIGWIVTGLSLVGILFMILGFAIQM